LASDIGRLRAIGVVTGYSKRVALAEAKLLGRGDKLLATATFSVSNLGHQAVLLFDRLTVLNGF
jgi:hypothetical protein